MSSSDSGGGGWGCLWLAVAIFLVMVALGHDPQESAVTGLKWGIGLWVAVVGGILGIAVLVSVGRTIGHNAYRNKRWDDIVDD